MKKRIAALLLCLALAAAVIAAAGAAKVHAEGEQYTVTFSLDYSTDNPVYHTVTAAPGEEITFPAAHSRTGYIFKGWYDTPIVETPLKQDNSIKAYTPTGDATLYALWMDERLNIPIGIGINLRYHCEGSTYWYPGSWTSKNAYQSLPNEPATIEHAALRTWKKNGAWIILSNNNEQENGLGNDYYSARLGPASDYVRWDFFTSPDLVAASDGTYGIADASGGKTRAMLSLTQADYDAIAAGWIAWAKDPANSFSAGEGYNDGWNNFALSKINWQDAGIIASDYKAVPYVVKYQTRNNILVWFIDMIVTPKNKYTLSYDRNLEHGYYLPGNQDFPQNSTYNEGEMAHVVLDPEVQPTNGTDTATFQYWVDEEGNKYGKGYITTIPMWSDKVLYAIWEYPDHPTMGSIRVTKTVVNADSTKPAPAETEFTFQAALKDAAGVPLTGAYTCRIYNANSQQVNTGDGKSLAHGDSFKLHDGWYIIIDHLPDGAVCAIRETPPTHYRAVDLPRQVAVIAGNTVPVTAEHYYQNTPQLLDSDIVLEQSEDGHFQVVEVFADAIQSLPVKAAQQKWGVTISADGTIQTVP